MQSRIAAHGCLISGHCWPPRGAMNGPQGSYQLQLSDGAGYQASTCPATGAAVPSPTAVPTGDLQAPGLWHRR